MQKIVMIFLLLFPLISVHAEELPIHPQVKAQGAVLMDYTTGRILWGKNETQAMPMASTTKIMTAIMALESGKLDELVTVSKNAANTPKVRMGLATGDQLSVRELLYPLMMLSANDAAVAIAEHLGGSVEGFCQQMTEKAKDLGCQDTLFETPNGLDKGDHHSTPQDMAIITRYALQNPDFREIISTASKTISSSQNRQYSLVNKNRLLKEFPGAIGVKTGFTGKAGQCFVGAASQDDLTLISVVLASGWGNAGKEQKWIDSKELLNYGFDQYQLVTLLDQNTPVPNLPVLFSKEGSVGAYCANSIQACMKKEEKQSVTIAYDLPQTLTAPVTKGEKIGSAILYCDGEKLGESPILVAETLERFDLNSNLLNIIKNWLTLGKNITI